MYELKVIKVAELRKKLAAIPGKLLIAALAVICLNWNTDLPTTLSALSAGYRQTILLFVIFYGVISYVRFFVKLTGGWLIGIIVSVVVAFLIKSGLAAIGPIGPDLENIIENNFGISFTPLLSFDNSYLIYVMLFGGPVLDLINLFRYLSLRNYVIHAHDHDEENAYGNGYNSGFDSGYARGLEQGSRYNDAIEGRPGRVGIGRRPSRRDYDDYYLEDEEEYLLEDEEYDDGYEDEDEGYYDAEDYDAIEDRRSPESGQSYFKDCKDEAALKRRYRDLCKVFHPDAEGGSAAIFQEITEEYHSLIGK